MKLVSLILKAVALGTVIGALVLSVMGSADIEQSITLLSISVTCLAISSLQNKT